ncbi:N-acetyltransferase [Rhodobacterales bacterium HKCCSP123]|nr:N-acetyltransferase [Rhodobacterales bacterium HKCCSP123]
MDRSELETVLSWAADEGWNPGLADAGAFHAADPGGFFLTSIDGAPVAAVSVVNHDAENTFLGLYLCRPEWRGKGLGLSTWHVGIEHAGARSIGLDGVPAQEGNYCASGFVKTGSSLRHEGRVEARRSPRVRPAAPDETARLVALDGGANGFVRPAFMTAWLETDSGTRETHVLLGDGAISGFATWRACRTGTKIGPIVAPDLSGALELLSDIARQRPEGPLVVDVPEGNLDLRRELEDAGFTVPFVTARMYRGRVPEAGQSLQAIATMELG